MYRLAHVTDPHFRSFDGARVGDFLGKRAVGTLNLVVNRRRHHKMELLAALGEDLRRERPDHLVVTGDLSNVSLDAEWQEALRWIEALQSSPHDVTVIPGNHDAYVPEVVVRGAFEAVFAPYQTPDRGDTGVAVGQSAAVAAGRDAMYPFVRLRGPLALVAVNSCVATGDFGAWGQVGSSQRERLEATLAAPDLVRRTRVVLIHHPLVRQKGGENRNLKDRQAVAELLGRSGADLVLHGHDHRDEKAEVLGPAGTLIPTIGAGSASYAGDAERRARYNIYEFDARAITMVTRAHDEATDSFRQVRRERIA